MAVPTIDPHLLLLGAQRLGGAGQRVRLQLQRMRHQPQHRLQHVDTF